MSSGYIASASFAQQQLRYRSMLQPDGSEYAVPLVISIHGNPDPDALHRAFDALIERHDVLRATLPLVDDIPMLAIADDRRIELPRIGKMAGDEAAWRREINAAVAAMLAEPFDMDKGPLLRAVLLQAAQGSYADCPMAMIIVLHHAIADGGSLPIMLGDLVAAYDAVLRKSPPSWDELPLQYPDYADWEQDRFGAPDAPALNDALNYWRGALDQAPAVLDLPLDRRRGENGPQAGAAARLAVPRDKANALEDLARRHGTTPFLAYLAVFFTVLHRWSGLDDMVVTVPVSKRERPELSQLVGMLVDTLPLRLACTSELTFTQLLDALRHTFHEGLRHRDAPFQRIVQAIGIERRSDVPPLMQVLFGAQEAGSAPRRAADGTLFGIVDDQADQAAKADISFVYRTGGDQLELWCRYDASIFDADTIQQLLGWFGTVMVAAAAALDRPLGELPLIGPDMGRTLIARYNDHRRAYPSEASVAELFAEVAGEFPDHIAIDDRGRRMNYAELARQSAHLASALAATGITQGDAVMLALPMSARFIALVLAVLRLGAIYVPLDLAHPPAHRARLASSIKARAVIVDEDYAESPPDTLAASALFDAAAMLEPFEQGRVAAGATAYVMFTSGSTGEPKGVAVPQRAIIRLVRDTNYAQFGPATRAAVYSNPSFDASTLELWAPLLNGGTAVIADKESVLDCARLRQLLERDRINVFWVTAGLFQELAGIDPGVFAGDRLVMTGGDAVNGDAARAVLAAGAGTGLRLLNCYGPTENTTFSTFFDLSKLGPDSLEVPIGSPIANSTVYILDRRGQPLPAGVIGEIYVGGDGVAIGYAGDPERTAAAFLPDPYDDRPGARMYRTGDHGRWRPDGTVLFAGRADDQIKLRGFRIELAEVATALAQHPDLRAVHVAAPRHNGGDRQLVAYVVPVSAPPAAADLRRFLEGLLPAHMLPHAYVILDALPLNANGKVDRKALPAVQDRHLDKAAERLPPRTEEESTLHGIWTGLLGLDGLGVDDNFFHIGGDSITAIRMAARATAAGLPLAPTDVFQLQTIKQLAEAAGARARARRIASEQIFDAELVPASPHGGIGRAFLLASLRLERSMTVLELALAMQRLAERHEALRLRWVRDGQAHRAEIMAYTARLPIRTVEAPGLSDARLQDWVDQHAERLGRGLQPENGVMVASTLIDRQCGAGDVVVLALHRAVADERTASVILGDLEQALTTGLTPTAPADLAGGLGSWLDWLRAHADAQAAGPGLVALESAAQSAGAELLAPGEPNDRDEVAARWTVGPAATETLIDLAAKQLMTSPLDLLCTALAEAAATVCSGDTLLMEVIDTERRLGRGAPNTDELAGNLECVLPIAAPLGPMAIETRLRTVKTARQAVEPAGPVFRILAHTFDLAIASVGVAWSATQGANTRASLHSPPAFGPAVRGMLLASTHGGQLSLAWAGQEPTGGASDLLRRIAATLETLARAGGRAADPLYTPADFPLAELSESELQILLADASDVQDIYPLSPMQEAMLVHTLAAGKSEINFEQSCMRIHGALDREALAHAWETVLHRHDALRTAFHWRGLARPMQVVHRRVELPLEFHDWPRFDSLRLDEFLAADRARGFELSAAPLLRLHAIQTASDELYLVSSFHHLLVDGWCLGRLEREVRAAYESFRSGRPALLDQPAAYKSYIDWLSSNDSTASRRFFADMLRDPPVRRRLHAPARAAASGYTTAKQTLSRPATRSLVAFTRRRGWTLAAAIHFAWAVWLASRLDSRDVVFGTTVSGRPAGVAGVESIVGLFINNLPVRLRLEAHATVGDGLAQLHALLGELQQHAYLSPAEIAEEVRAPAAAGILFDTLVVVENLASGTSAWAGAEGLVVETVQSRLKTAYDLTFIAVPGDAMVLSLVQPVDDRRPEDGQAALEALAAILAALPDAADEPLTVLPRPVPLPYLDMAPRPANGGLRLSTRPRSTLEARIAAIVADLAPSVPATDASMDDCGLDTDFWQLGLTSLELTQLALRLAAALDRPVPIALLLEHRTIASLAAAIQKGQSWSPIVVMSGQRTQDGEGEPFICVHPIAGDVSVFLDLARAMPPQIPFWALQAPGLEEGQAPLPTVQALAEANLQALAARGKPSPRWIGGYSFGGMVAFEMARQLAAQGRMPERVVILDTPAPLPRASILNSDPDRAQAEWLLRMVDVRARFQGRQTPLSLDELLALPAEGRFDLALARSHAAGLLPSAATVSWLRRAHHCSLVQYDAYLAYQPVSSSCRDLPLAIIRAAQPIASDLGDDENAQLALPAMGWQAYADIDIAVHAIDGDHVSMLGPDTAGQAARAISRLLRDSQSLERKARAAE